MVAPQRLGQSARGGIAASKGWSQVAQDDAHCARLRSNPKIPSKTVKVVGKPGHTIQASYQDHGFHSGKATRKEHAPKYRSKVEPSYYYKSSASLTGRLLVSKLFQTDEQMTRKRGATTPSALCRGSQSDMRPIVDHSTAGRYLQ